MLRFRKQSVCLEEKVSCEIRESPSMMWKRSIVQAKAARARVSVDLLLAIIVFSVLWRCGLGADLVIEIPGWGAGGGPADGAHYRLDYRPPIGSPKPNYTVAAQASTINFQGQPGTKYHFMLYYSNATFADLLTWNQTIITAPEPPTNLTVTLGRNKQATISWSPPAHGDYTGFRFKVIPLTERTEGGVRNLTVEGAGNWTYTLRDLSPGATYQLHAFTLLHDKESAAYASFNFTTKPNTPGKFIVWFRNETTLLVLWQPPYPPGAYTHYKVSIEPRDARDSELYVEKEGEPPGPAQAAFKGLVPGRAYNISVQTVSEPQLSAPTTAQYRTVPLRPRNVTLDARSLTETSFRVTWLPPAEQSEFEKYQVMVSSVSAGGSSGARRLPGVVRGRNETSAAFDGLEPGAHLTVTVKTMSGKVTSWPASAELTLKPLPVRGLQWRAGEGERIELWWTPAEGSLQDEYKVSYHEEGPARDDSNALTTPATNATLDSLLPGRNYTISVVAVSRGVESNASAVWAATRPWAPALREAAAGERALRLAWRSDVDSRQRAYLLRYRRRRTPASSVPNQPWTEFETPETNATLEDLEPGAVYEIQLAAISHGLRSEWYTVLKPVRPRPPVWLEVARATSNSVRVRWRGPAEGALGAFALRWHTAPEPPAAPGAPHALPQPPSATDAEITNMTHGERYTILLDTVSEEADGDSVESGHPISEYHTVRPNPVTNVAQSADTRNLTLEWPRPSGRVEGYEVRWALSPDEHEEPGDGGDGSEGGEGGEGGEAGETREGEAGARNVSALGGGPAHVLLGRLRPGRAYRVSIVAHSYNLSSETFTLHTRTRPLIQSEMIVNELDDNNAGNATLPALMVRYTATPRSESRFDSYWFRLEAAGSPPRSATRSARDSELRVLFDRLVPGRLYNLTMWTVSRNITSHPVQRPARLLPRGITVLNATEINARNITLAWDRPEGDYTAFSVQYLADGELESAETDRLGLTVRGLRPYTEYTFTVVVQAGKPTTLLTRSRTKSETFRTHEAPPAAPSSFQLSDAKPTELTFRWELPPQDRHGRLQHFVIEYAPQHDPKDLRFVQFPPEARNGTVSGLSAGVTYEFQLRGATGARTRCPAPCAAPPPPSTSSSARTTSHPPTATSPPTRSSSPRSRATTRPRGCRPGGMCIVCPFGRPTR